MKLITLSRLALGASLAFACGDNARSSAAPAAGRPIVIGTTVDLGGVNGITAANTRFTQELLDLLFASLLAERPDFADHPPTFDPDLAESWQLSDDRRSLTVRLRGDARWSDGAPISAADVAFTLRAQRSPEVAWPYADSKGNIDSVAELDARTVRFDFSRVHPYQLVDLNDGRIFPEHRWSVLPFASWRTAGDWFRQHLVSSGPYRLASWRPGIELTLEPSADKGAGDRALSRLNFRVVPDSTALVEQLLAGDLDLVDGLAPLDAERLAASGRVRIVSSSTRQYDYIAWNLRRPPFDDLDVRRALTMAIDRGALVDALWRGHARVAVGPVPSTFWACDRSLAPWPYDPAAARTLLAEAGYRDDDGDGLIERNGRPLRFELATNSGNRTRAEALILIQEQLRRVGVDALPRLVEIQALTDRNLAGDFDATLSGWSVDTTLDLSPYFHSAEIAAGWNFVAFTDPQADRLLDALRATADIDAARPLLLQLQRIVHDQQPYTFLWEPDRLVGVRLDIDGVVPTPLSLYASAPRWRRVAAPGPLPNRP